MVIFGAFISLTKTARFPFYQRKPGRGTYKYTEILGHIKVLGG
jgi:hypothetical protein